MLGPPPGLERQHAMEPRLAEMLASMIGEKWLEPIGNLGVHTIDDLRYLSQEDLKGLGMTLIEVRKTHEVLATHSYWYHAP